MTEIMANDLERLWQARSRVFLNAGIAAGMILIALFFSSRPNSASPIVYVHSQDGGSFLLADYSVTDAEKAPPVSELVSGRYDAYVAKAVDGRYAIITARNADYERGLRMALEGKAVAANAQASRGRGSTIAGFLLMFIMMQGTITLYLFSDDKELKILPRIASTSIAISRYLTAHGAFAFLAILVPDLCILYAIRFLTGADIGFTFAQYLSLFAVAAILSTTFSPIQSRFRRFFSPWRS